MKELTTEEVSLRNFEHAYIDKLILQLRID